MIFGFADSPERGTVHRHPRLLVNLGAQILFLWVCCFIIGAIGVALITLLSSSAGAGADFSYVSCMREEKVPVTLRSVSKARSVVG
jgi:hypothetical protein